MGRATLPTKVEYVEEFHPILEKKIKLSFEMVLSGAHSVLLTLHLNFKLSSIY